VLENARIFINNRARIAAWLVGIKIGVPPFHVNLLAVCIDIYAVNFYGDPNSPDQKKTIYTDLADKIIKNKDLDLLFHCCFDACLK